MMEPLRKALASVASAAVVLGAFPRAALANKPVAAPVAAAPQSDGALPPPAEVMKKLKEWGAFKGDDDVLKTYLGDAGHLTPLGRALYLSLVRAHDPSLEGRAISEELLAMQPAFDKLRDNGPYDANRQASVQRTIETFQRSFGKVKAGGSLEADYQNGALREALMNGAAVADPPQPDELVQVPTKDGYEFWDLKGLAFRINKNNATTYSRELQKMQRAMNQSRPPQVAFIPETGRYNPQMFDYSYFLLKNQYQAIWDGMNRERTIALAELLGDAAKYREDMWFTSDRIQKDIEAKARNKTYRDKDGNTVSVWDIVERKFKQREYYLAEALKGVQRFESDMKALKEELKGSGVIGDSQVQSLGMDEQYTRRFLTLGVIETQTFEIKNQMEHLDPSSPDSEQVMKAIDESDMTPLQKASYKNKARDMVKRLQALNAVLEHSRAALHASDYAGSMDVANAAIQSAQRQLGLLSTDYSMYVEIPTLGFLGKQQLNDGWSSWLDFGSKLTRGGWRLASSRYARNMDGIEAARPKYAAIARLIADGKLAEARQAVIDLDPDAVKGAFSAALGGDPAKITDAARVAAALKAGHDRIVNVYETNEWLDTAGRFITWSVEMAVAAPLARGLAAGGVKLLAKYTGEVQGAAEYPWYVTRPAIFASETLKHVGARLGSLDPDPTRINAIAGESAIARYALTTTVRAGSVAMRQAAFTLTSGAISGAFTAGQHLWDEASLKVFKPGQSLTTPDLPVVGEIGFRPTESAFNGVGDAAWAGFKGGVIWANKPMEVFGLPLIHPGLLGYVNIPSTVFRGTRLAEYMEVLGSRGVVGSSIGMGKLFFASGNEVAALEGATQKGLLERMAANGGVPGKVGAFTLSMADNVAKYAVFSNVVGGIGRAYDYNVNSFHVPILGNVGGHADEPDLERRIKSANLAGAKMFASPAWMLLPSYAAHTVRDAQSAWRGMQGARQYDEAGRTKEYVNLEPGAEVKFLQKPSVPLSQAFFETSFLSRETGDTWAMTDQIKREGIKKIMPEMLGGKGATPATINPMRFLLASKLADGADFVDLKVNDQVRLVAHQNFIESLLADPARAKKILGAELGANVEGFGRVTPEVQKDVAVALFSSEMQIGKAMPKELAVRVNEILKPYLDANTMVKPAADAFAKALDRAPAKSAALDAALQQTLDKVVEWRKTANPDEVPYTQLLRTLSADADRLKADGKLDEKEHAVLASLLGDKGYLQTIEARFNAFNKTSVTARIVDETLGALKVQFTGSRAAQDLVGRFAKDFHDWAAGRGPDARVYERPGQGGSYQVLINQMGAELEKARGGLSEPEYKALKAGIKEVKDAPWVLHDANGDPLPSWRPEQFESLMGALTEFSRTGRAGNAPQIFQMLKTGGGKTMLTFEGLLPLIEADAHARGLKPMFLTVQSNLEAQARMEFLAYKKIGSTLEFDTYEGFKTKIAEKKMKGQDALAQYWILGDEMDGAALQPALTIGQVTGGISKLSPVFNRIEEMDAGLGHRLLDGRSARDSRLMTEARRLRGEVDGLDSFGSGAAKAKAARTLAEDLEAAVRKLQRTTGEARRAAVEAEIAERAEALRQALGELPASGIDAISGARSALDRISETLRAPEAPATAKPSGWRRLRDFLSKNPETDPAARARDEVLADIAGTLTREENLLSQAGSEEGLSRLAVEARGRQASLRDRIASLETRLAEQKGPRAEERAALLREDLALARRELKMVESFVAVDSGRRLTTLQDRIAEEEAAREHGLPTGPKERYEAWVEEAGALRRGLSEDARDAADARAASLKRVHDLGAEYRGLEAEVERAQGQGKPVDALRERMTALDSESATRRAEVERLKRGLSAGSADGDLGGMLRRLEVLRGEEAALASRGGSRARLSEVRAESRALSRRAQQEVRKRLKAAGDEVAALAREGRPGWQDAALRLLESRRGLLRAYGGDENPMYSAFRDMKDDMESFAMNQALQSPDEAVWRPAHDTLMRLVEGKGFFKSLLPTIRMVREVFAGEPVDVPMNEVGLTRYHAAKMLKALGADPTMPVHQRDNLFWDLSSSLLFPGREGRSSWVRTELLRQLRGFEEKFQRPGDIRFDNRTGKINVVHNGQWFESMDNEGRRFWELEYGADLTLPYTNQSISTIKDVTMNKKARFISFSGTAGEKLQEHFRKEKISIVGKGSEAPERVDLDVLGGPSDRFQRIGQALLRINSSREQVVVEALDGAPQAAREQIEGKLGGPLRGTRALKLSDFAAPELKAARDWLAAERALQGDANAVVFRRLSDLPRLSDEAAAALRAELGSGRLAGEARKALEDVLSLDAVSDSGRAALTEAMKSWTSEPLSAVRGSVESQLAANVPKDVREVLDFHLKSKGWGGKDEAVLKISGEGGVVGPDGPDGAKTLAAQRWLRDLRANQKDTSLLVLSVSDTRVLKTVREYLIRGLGVKPDEIASVFSDTEYLRNNVPEARVAEQMNLGALEQGKARVLILDTRVGGRGLNLKFRGTRSSDPKSFRGYTNFEMLIVDPHKMSAVHLLQAEGRIDTGRVLLGAQRDFALVMDVQSVQGESVFRKMIAEEPFFNRLREDPRFIDYARARGVTEPKWSDFQGYLRERAYDGTADGALLAEQYRQAIKDVVQSHLDAQQQEVEEEQLRSSSVLQEPRRGGGRFPGLESMR